MSATQIAYAQVGPIRKIKACNIINFRNVDSNSLNGKFFKNAVVTKYITDTKLIT